MNILFLLVNVVVAGLLFGWQIAIGILVGVGIAVVIYRRASNP